jgi:hypothetical protein
MSFATVERKMGAKEREGKEGRTLKGIKEPVLVRFFRILFGVEPFFGSSRFRWYFLGTRFCK